MLLRRWINYGNEPLRGHRDHRPDGAREGDLQPGHQEGKQHRRYVLRSITFSFSHDDAVLIHIYCF